jgi:hypothetical protein
MAQQANITLNSVVYASGGTKNGVTTWTNRSGGVGASFTNVHEEFVQPAKGKVVRMKFSLDVPVVATTDSVCGCAGTLLRTSTCQISVWVPQDSSAAERTDLLARITSLVGTAPFTNGVGNLDPTWG